MERNLGPTGTMPGPQPTRAGSDEATVMERLTSTAAPTAAEQKWSGNAEATMIERQVSPASFAPKKSNTGMMIGIAAALVIILGGIGLFVWKNRQPATTVAPVSTTVVTTTAPAPVAPMPAGQGVLLLSASPWGDLEKIVDEKGKTVDLTDDKKSTPTRIELEPGKYAVTVASPSGTTQTMNVQVEAGKQVRKTFDFGNVNFDELEKEVSKP